MSLSLNEEQKVSVLLAALQERYESVRIIRERMQTICIWALGLLLAAAGWLIQSNIALTLFQKLMCVAGVAAAFVVLRFYYLADLYTGFKGQQRTAVRLEKALGLFSPGMFDDEKDSLYPERWLSAGTDKGEGRFFHSIFALLYVGIAFLIIAIIFHGCTGLEHFWSHHIHRG
jgi:hypothetical protein